MRQSLDITGQKFGHLVVLRRAENSGHMWVCLCVCGNSHTVRAGNLRGGSTKSCGCRRWTVKHGGSRRRQRHPIYGLWKGMHMRCNNPHHQDYKYYGARGVTVCERWKDFASFLADVGERPGPQFSLDRIDGDGNYEPSNVRWATATQQSRNRRPYYLSRSA